MPIKARLLIFIKDEIEGLRVWEKKGFLSIYEYAGKLAGMSRRKVDDALRLLKKIEDKPELKRVIEEKGMGAVQPVATIATKDTASFWAKKARVMSKNTLETYVREIRVQNGSLEYLSPRGDVVYLDNVENVQLKNSLKNTSNQIMIKKMDLALKEYAPTQNN